MKAGVPDWKVASRYMIDQNHKNGARTARSWKRMTQIWKRMAQSWKRMAQSWKRMAQSWKRTAQSWKRTAQSWKRTAQSWKRMAQIWKRMARSWKRMARSWKRMAQSWKRMAQIWKRMAQSWKRMAQIWKRMAQIWKRMAQSWKRMAQSWKRMARSWKRVARSWKRMPQSWKRMSRSIPRIGEIHGQMAEILGRMRRHPPWPPRERGGLAARIALRRNSRPPSVGSYGNLRHPLPPAAAHTHRAAQSPPADRGGAEAGGSRVHRGRNSLRQSLKQIPRFSVSLDGRALFPRACGRFLPQLFRRLLDVARKPRKRPADHAPDGGEPEEVSAERILRLLVVDRLG